MASPQPTAEKTEATESRGRNRLPLIGGLVTGMVVCSAGAWWMITPAVEAPPQRLQRALNELDSDRHFAARLIVEELAEEKYHDVDFAGGIEYVLGMSHFQEALERTQTDAGAAYATAVTYLKEAERRGIPADRRSSWVFAMALSLYHLGDWLEAMPLLEEASHPSQPQSTTAAASLIDLYVDPTWRTPARLKRAWELNDQLLGEELSSDQRVAALEQRIEVAFAMKAWDRAEPLIEELSTKTDHQPLVDLLRARLQMGREEFVEAVRLLETVARDDLLNRTVPRQAVFLMGLAAEGRVNQIGKSSDVDQRPQSIAQQMEYRQRAMDYFRKTISRYEGTHEAVAAHMHLGHLQQEDGAYEKALQSFGTALRSVSRAEDYSNRWMGLEEFRQRILVAWNSWIQAGNFQEAIALSDLMITAFPRDQAYELSARARQRWAEQTEVEYTQATATHRASQRELLFRRWRDSAEAHARLADSRRAATNYLDAVWLAVQHYYSGHDFDSALKYVDQFLDEETEAMRPVALVLRGRILMDLDRLPEAEESFRIVRKLHPTSPASFAAAFHLAVCRLEQDDIAGADAAWRSILTSSELSPSATEWREALISLAQLQFDRASWSRRQLESRNLDEPATKTLWNQVGVYSRESSSYLEEYVARYPEAVDLPRAKYILAKSLQLQGDIWHLQEQQAETANAREQARKQHTIVLRRALDYLQQVREALAPLAEEDRLDPLQRQLNVNTWFELPHTLFALRDYEEAITAYGAAVHRFPQDVRVLTAYVQMAEAFARLNRPIEARSMLEQAKVILDQDQIPTAAFQAATTSLSRVEWEEWLNRVRTVHRD